ncbi:MAG: heavy-metal-associated domain-containing protein [Solirubrobacterales bacterium]
MKKKIIIEGMSCGHCVNHVKEALMELKGVQTADVDLDTKTAVISFDSNIADEIINDAIEDVGYDVVRIEVI